MTEDQANRIIGYLEKLNKQLDGLGLMLLIMFLTALFIK
jgi:hypothetical protein